MRMTLTARSMAAFWLVGFEDQPERSGEICVAEIFGDAIDGDITQVGMGVHKFRDPDLEEAFTTIPMTIDVCDLPHLWRRLDAWFGGIHDRRPT